MASTSTSRPASRSRAGQPRVAPLGEVREQLGPVGHGLGDEPVGLPPGVEPRALAVLVVPRGGSGPASASASRVTLGGRRRPRWSCSWRRCRRPDGDVGVLLRPRPDLVGRVHGPRAAAGTTPRRGTRPRSSRRRGRWPATRPPSSRSAYSSLRACKRAISVLTGAGEGLHFDGIEASAHDRGSWREPLRQAMTRQGTTGRRSCDDHVSARQTASAGRGQLNTLGPGGTLPRSAAARAPRGVGQRRPGGPAGGAAGTVDDDARTRATRRARAGRGRGERATGDEAGASRRAGRRRQADDRS